MSNFAWAQVDLHSFCFDKTTNLNKVNQSLNFLLLPRDIVEQRPEDNCLDIITLPDRANLFEKFLSKRYDLKHEVTHESTKVGASSCRLDFKTTNQSKVDVNDFKIGQKNTLRSSETNNRNSSTMELLLGFGNDGDLEVASVKLKVKCQIINDEKANLIFSFNEKNKGSLSTEITANKNEWINVGSVVKDLNEKNKTLGIPQTELNESKRQMETVYELQWK